MDLSMLPTPVSDYDKPRTGARFTVCSASSPSYSLVRRPGVRRPRGFSVEERESTEEAGQSERYGAHTGTNGAAKEEVQGSRSSVKGQCKKTETSGYERCTKLSQNGTGDKTITEIGTDRSKTCNPASEGRGRTDWRRYNPPSRSKSVDWRAAASSPDRGKASDVSSTKSGLVERRTEVEGVRGRVMSSIQAYNSAGMSQTLDRTSRGNSLPTRLRSLSLTGSGVKVAASSFGPKGGQSIMERIEKLYGSTGGKNMDFTTSTVPSHHRETTADFFTSPKQRSYERTRHFSSEERRVVNPVESRKSFPGAHKDISQTQPSQETSRTSLSALQWQGQTQGWYSEGNWGRGLQEMGTQSLDRARSRYSVAAQIRSARAAAGITPSRSSAFLEEERSFTLRGMGSKDQGGVKGETIAIRGTSSERSSLLEKPGKEEEAGAKDKKEMKSRNTDEDVFDSNTQKITMKSIESRKFPDRSMAAPTASVRNKINQFEALTQRAQGITMHRRAFSVPAHLSETHDGVKKSGSAKAIGGLRYKWEGEKEGEKAAEETKERVTGGGKKLGSNRSLSVDEVGLRYGRKEREGNNLVEDQGNKMEGGTSGARDFGKYSSLKNTLELPLNAGAQRQGRNFYIDETDFHKISSPKETLASSLISSDSSAGVKKVTSPVSDEDETPTNSPNNSPFLSPTTKLGNDVPDAGNENKSSSVLTQAAKTPEQPSPPLPRPLATSSLSNIHDFFSPDVNAARPNGKKQLMDLDAWVAGLSPNIKVWNDEEDDYEDDDDSTQRDEDSNYDSDSGESSVTITSSMSQADHKSFSVSLSDLCNFAGVDYDSDNDSDEWQSSRRTASLSSDMSALSCVSVMPSEELDRLLEDVRSVGDSSLQDYNDVQVVVLHKDVGVGLGFSVAGGIDQNKPVTVHRVFHSGVAAKEGSIREGDQVLSINGTALCSYAHWEALRVLRRAKTREMGVVVLRRGGISTVSKGGARTNNQGQTQAPFTETGQLVCVRLEKNSRDLGFSLEGGVDSNLGNRPLTVQKIFQGGPVDKVCPGDQVEEIEGVSVVGMRRLEAWTLIRRLAPGPVDVVLRRHAKPLET